MADAGVDATIAKVLERSRTIAVVGMSRREGKPSFDVPRQLQQHGFRIIPVNPYADEILGEKAYATLSEIPEHVDLVDVFRPSKDTPEVARQAVAIGADAIWLQLGIASDEARAIAEAGGLDYVENRCIAVERRRLGVEH